VLLECELCGAHYKADIADAHVQGGRLTFTCKSCGKEVVVIGDPADRSRRAGVLLPDQGDGPIESLPAPPEVGLPQPEAAVPVPEPVLPQAPAQAPAPEPSFSVPEKKGPSPILLGIGGAVILAVVFGVFVRPILSGKPEGAGPVKPAPQASPAAPIVAGASTPAPTVLTAAPAASPSIVPTPESGPVVQIKELRTPEARPSPVPTAKKETVRDAATLIDPGAIQEAFIRARPLYRLCAVTEMKRDPEAKLGTIVASLTIAPTGAVLKVAFDRADLASSPLGQCVHDALAKMTFPAFEGAPAVLRQPISLEVPAGR
jgi:hypothetical protein